MAGEVCPNKRCFREDAPRAAQETFNTKVLKMDNIIFYKIKGNEALSHSRRIIYKVDLLWF